MSSNPTLKNKKVKFCVSYGRISTLDQGNDDDGNRRDDGSPEAQKKRCLDYIQHLERKDNVQYHHLEHISDEGFSGKNTNRPGYQHLWDLISARKIDLIVATELSRLSRSVADFLDLVAHCEKHDVAIAILGMDFETSSPFGRMMVVILVALAQFERETTGLRVKENGRIRLLKDGKINGAGEILGLDRDPSRKGHFVKNEEELARVEEILKLYLQLPSKRLLLAALREKGVKGKHGKEISHHMLDIILKNVSWRYRGYWPANKENKDNDSEHLPESKRYQLAKLPHGPLIDENLLNKVREKIEDTFVKRKKVGKDEYVYFLTNVLKFEDETGFTGEVGRGNGGEYRYYRNSVNDTRIRCDEIDPIICTRIKTYIQNHAEFEKLLESAIKQRQMELPKLEVQVNQISKELEKIERAEADLRDKLLDSSQRSEPNFMRWLEDQVSHLEGKKRQKTKELEMLERVKADVLRKAGLADLKATIQEFVNDYDRLTGTEKRNLLEKIVRRVIIKRDNELVIELFGEPPISNGGGKKFVNERNTGSNFEMNGSQGGI